MNKDNKIARRDVLRALGAGAAVAAAAPVVATTPAQAAQSDSEAKKARYNPNSEDVKNFYRVNGY